MFAQPIPSRRFLVLRDSMYDEALSFTEDVEPIEKLQRCPMTIFSAQEGPGLAGYKVGGEDLLIAR